MSVARLGREISSEEFMRWTVFYRLEDRAKAGKLDED